MVHFGLLLLQLLNHVKLAEQKMVSTNSHNVILFTGFVSICTI